MKTTKARVSLDLPASLKSAAEGYARRDGVSLNQFIATAVAEKVGAQGAAKFFAERAAAAIAFLRSAPDRPPDQEDALQAEAMPAARGGEGAGRLPTLNLLAWARVHRL